MLKQKTHSNKCLAYHTTPGKLVIALEFTTFRKLFCSTATVHIGEKNCKNFRNFLGPRSASLTLDLGHLEVTSENLMLL